MSARPPEPRGGQDDPPEVRPAVHATIRLLSEIVERRILDEDHELLLRVEALRSALSRLRRRLEAEAGG